MKNLLIILLLAALPDWLPAAVPVSTVEELVAVVRDGEEGAVIEVGPGRHELAAPLALKAGMTLKGAGVDRTILTHAPEWRPSVATLPDPEMTTKGMDTEAYLIRLTDSAAGIAISGMTLTAPQLHGAIFGFGNEGLHLHDLRIQDVLWSGVRTFKMTGAKIHDCEFIDAGGKWKKGGIPSDGGGISAGAIFAVWMADSEISHNRFTRTQMDKADGFYGIKGRQGRRCRIHHNTIGVSFSIEFPSEGDEDMEIDHNVLHGVISIPKPESGRTFHIHHNWMTTSYAIEFVRNGVEIDHNLFDFQIDSDGGNLISGFGKAGAPGPAWFHNNLVSNPGRGVIWINEPYSNLEIQNNHIISRTTVTPRTEGLLGFHPQSDFGTIRIVNNVVECEGTARPLLRKGVGANAVIENNRLVNVTDADDYGIPTADAKPGLEAPLKFECGVRGEVVVDGWKATPKSAP